MTEPDLCKLVLAYQGGAVVKANYSSLMQSKYFNPAFNSAIFDGPMRIYFAQFHESMALKIYFLSQQKISKELDRAREISKTSHSNVLVMIYPTPESFCNSFQNNITIESQKVCVENWNNDLVVGLNGPLDEAELEAFMQTLSDVVRDWNPKAISLEPSSELLS